MSHLSMQVFGVDIIQVLEVLIALAATYVIAKIVSKSLERVFEKTPFPEDMERLITRVTKYVVYIVGVLATISITGFDLTSVIVGLGAFSIALSFAMSTIAQNFASGVLVQADKAFKVGDQIKVQNFEGEVVKISIRTTVIENEDRDTIFIPNSIFMTTPVIRKRNNDTSKC